MQRLLFVISCTILFFSVQVQSNEGTEFWFGFMEHRDVGSNSMVVMITSKRNTSGTVRIPGIQWAENFSVASAFYSTLNVQ